MSSEGWCKFCFCRITASVLRGINMILVTVATDFFSCTSINFDPVSPFDILCIPLSKSHFLCAEIGNLTIVLPLV